MHYMQKQPTPSTEAPVGIKERIYCDVCEQSHPRLCLSVWQRLSVLIVLWPAKRIMRWKKNHCEKPPPPSSACAHLTTTIKPSIYTYIFIYIYMFHVIK